MQIRLGPDGLHLFHRRTGTNILLDEVTAPPSLWSTAPRNVSVALTNACDLHCPYCYAPKTPAHLDTELLVTCIDELDSHGCLAVGFGGGEPTLCAELPSLCAHIQHDTEMAATFTTHGHHLNDSLATALNGNVHFIRISMDGIGRTYEGLRGRSFSRLLEAIKIAASLAPFGINIVVNARTFPSLDHVARISADLGATELLLLPEQPTATRPGIDRSTAASLVAWVQHYRGHIPLTISEAHPENLETCNPLRHERGLRGYAHIDAHAQLKRSSYDTCGISIVRGGFMDALRRLDDLPVKEQR